MLSLGNPEVLMASRGLFSRRSAGLGRTRLFHPWGREPEGGGQAPMFPCRTLSDLEILDSGQSPVMSHRDGF